MMQAVLFSLLFMVLSVIGQSEVSKTPSEEKEKALVSMDIAKEAISKAKGLYPDCYVNVTSKTTVCGKKEQAFGFLNVGMNLISEARENVFQNCKPANCHKLYQWPSDCSELLENGDNTSGIYTIYPRSRISVHESLDVFCDMDTDGGGWTVIQRRGSYSEQEDFYRDWEEYKNGFGNLTSEFWIGNNNIFTLSNQAPYSIRFDMQDDTGESNFAVYQSFWIEDELNAYKVHISGYTGKAGDSMTFHNGMKFTTKDRKNDIYGHDPYGPNCADLGHSGWWYKNCAHCNPNGVLLPGFTEHNNFTMMNWGAWKPYTGLAAMEIKLRPLQ